MDFLVIVVAVPTCCGVTVGHLAADVGHIRVSESVEVSVEVPGDGTNGIFIDLVVAVVVDLVAVLCGTWVDGVIGVVAVVVGLGVAVRYIAGDLDGVAHSVAIAVFIDVVRGSRALTDCPHLRVDEAITVVVDAITDLECGRVHVCIGVVAVFAVLDPILGSVAADETR